MHNKQLIKFDVTGGMNERPLGPISCCVSEERASYTRPTTPIFFTRSIMGKNSCVKWCSNTYASVRVYSNFLKMKSWGKEMDCRGEEDKREVERNWSGNLYVILVQLVSYAPIISMMLDLSCLLLMLMSNKF